MIARHLEAWLKAGGSKFGEIAIRRIGSGFVLTHRDEAETPGLERFTRPEDARHLALRDDHGAYRPLKTAPTLRHGWRLELGGEAELLLALDLFYPAAAGIFAVFEQGKLRTVPLRATLARQTGMYAVTRKMTEEEARRTIRACCEGGCLKTILWELEPGAPVSPAKPAAKAGEFPLLCPEACNWFVAAARKTVKARP